MVRSLGSFLAGAAEFQAEPLLSTFQVVFEDELLLPSFWPAGVPQGGVRLTVASAAYPALRLTVASVALPVLIKGSIAVCISWTASGSH